ncbi:hypothetical protein INR49_008695 [Caranx melampygus]|nr:hypothetical protein INR49_008695 [Caranx melampygus]
MMGRATLRNSGVSMSADMKWGDKQPAVHKQTTPWLKCSRTKTGLKEWFQCVVLVPSQTFHFLNEAKLRAYVAHFAMPQVLLLTHKHTDTFTGVDKSNAPS